MQWGLRQTRLIRQKHRGSLDSLVRSVARMEQILKRMLSGVGIGIAWTATHST